ncbi:hypothetical protein [Nocardioides euryhalodurans]|uniref:DUF4352 domain-containing protein n=1 Tax=Nocardioides euryhalodurans TaxID=2518370 RepID=A0A4P7GHY0_9ACTN|nr:hypothetical protein [Nocardioides euryhalodurans]QBR91403.1 hypothetical protein EXE57_03325 [Nocardioides euryhalodurans]
MSDHQPPAQYPAPAQGDFQGQPHPQQGYGYQQAPPPKKKHTVRNVLLILAAVFVLFVGGCLAIVGTAANEVSKAIERGENEAGGRSNPVTITEGEAFEVRGFEYAAGWRVGKDAMGYINVSKLKVTNNRESSDSALVEIKFWKGSEVLALTDCTTEPIEVGTTTQVDCLAADKLPRSYDKITINDTF